MAALLQWLGERDDDEGRDQLGDGENGDETGFDGNVTLI
jgi:hypothetical protein